MSSMMKVDQDNQNFDTKKALGAGIQNILFTYVRNVEQAKNCISIVKAETPKMSKTNGCHMRRNVKYVIDCASKEYIKAIDEEAVVSLMIEKRTAVDQLEEIFTVKGIDMVQFGPGDYSMSLGLDNSNRFFEVVGKVWVLFE
jgi:2-keto-3-deoxy-L-rhamnonate aldolase RhmA